MNRTGHGRSPTGAILLHCWLRAAVGSTMVWGCAVLVCGCGRATTSQTEAPLARTELNPTSLDTAAKFGARPIQAATRRPVTHTAIAAGFAAPPPAKDDRERPAEFQLSPSVLPSEADWETLEPIPLPPVEDEDGNEPDVDKQGTQVEPGVEERDHASAPRGPALESPESERDNRQNADENDRTASRESLPPDFAEAFVVQPRQTIDPDARLAPLSGPSDPTPALVAVARQADAHIAQGFALAQRGAIFTARAEFLRALRLSVAALDGQRQTEAHSRALVNGLRALEEAEEFVSAAGTQRAGSIETIVAGHQTPVLHEEPTDGLTAPHALQRYLTYAQDQLAAAAGDLQPAAMAFYALGKLEITANSAEIGSLASARAAVYLQAALIVNPRHAPAANELGVLLAGHGRLEEAKAALLHSVRTAPQAVAWRNLAIVHHRLGEHDLAGRADWEWRQAIGGGSEATIAQHPSVPHVQWVDPATFARSTNATSGVALTPAQSRPSAQPQNTAAESQAPSATKNASIRWPWQRAR